MPVRYSDCRTTERTFKAYKDKRGVLRHKISTKSDCAAVPVNQEQQSKSQEQENEHESEEEITLEEIREMFRRFLK